MNNMKIIHIQLQPDLCSAERAGKILRTLEQFTPDNALIHEVNVASGDDDGKYINFNFTTSRPFDLWCSIQNALHLKMNRRSPRKTPLFVLCQGKFGWDDYLLLYCFDKRKTLDKLEVTDNDNY